MDTYPENLVRPIERLTGEKLNDKWEVVELLPTSAFQTGSCFSVGYAVQGVDGTRAFAKVLDFSRALQEPDTARALNEMTQTYIFERSLLELCGKYNLSQVVRGLDFGEVSRSDVPLGKLFFIVFEMAESDVRKYLHMRGNSDLSWRLRILKDISLGISQLHGKKISHQDIKPSNVLVFNKGEQVKLGDLGRAHCPTLTAPHDGHQRPGAFHYAPPEQLYDHHFADRALYRRAGDLYLLGSMLDFFVAGTPSTVRLMGALEEIHRPFAMQENGWRGYFLDVLPYLQAAHAGLVQSFSQKASDLVGASRANRQLSDEITNLYRYSTDPNPLTRGHPDARRTKHSSDYDLMRFVSAFDIIGKKLSIAERK